MLTKPGVSVLASLRVLGPANKSCDVTQEPDTLDFEIDEPDDITDYSAPAAVRIVSAILLFVLVVLGVASVLAYVFSL